MEKKDQFNGFMENQPENRSESNEYIVSQIKRFFPTEELPKIFEHIPAYSIKFYQQVLQKLPKIPEEATEIDAWKSQIKKRIEDTKDPLHSALSQIAYENVIDLETKYVTMTDQDRYEMDKIKIRSMLKKEFVRVFTNLEVIEEVIKNNTSEEINLNKEYGEEVTQRFCEIAPATFFLDFLAESVVTQYYAIPEDETNVHRWVTKLINSEPRLNQVATEIFYSLRTKEYRYVDDEDEMMKAIITLMQAEIEDIALLVSVNRPLDLKEDILAEVQEMSQYSRDIKNYFFQETTNFNRELLKFLKNRFYENRKVSRTIEHQILSFIFKQEESLKRLYQQKPESRVKIIMLLRLVLKSRTSSIKNKMELEELHEKIGPFIKYKDIISKNLALFLNQAPPVVKDYIENEKYILDAKSFDKESMQLDITINHFRDLEFKNLFTKKELHVFKLSFFLSTNFDGMPKIFSTYQDYVFEQNLEENAIFEEDSVLMDFVENHVLSNEEIMYFIRIFYKLLPDKIRFVYQMDQLIPEIIKTTFSLYITNYRYLSSIFNKLNQQESFNKLVMIAPDKAVASMMMFIEKKDLGSKFLGGWEGNALQKAMLNDIVRSNQEPIADI